MMLAICFLVFAPVRHVCQNFGTHVIMYSDFIVIVEFCIDNLSLMSTSLIILTAVRNLKSIIYLSLLLF